MISEILLESLKISIKREVVLFLENGFRFEGKILDCDNQFLKIWDTKKGFEKFIRLSEIIEVELK